MLTSKLNGYFCSKMCAIKVLCVCVLILNLGSGYLKYFSKHKQ